MFNKLVNYLNEETSWKDFKGMVAVAIIAVMIVANVVIVIEIVEALSRVLK